MTAWAAGSIPAERRLSRPNIRSEAPFRRKRGHGRSIERRVRRISESGAARWAVEPVWRKAGDFSEGLASRFGTAKAELISTAGGRTVFRHDYDLAGPFSEGRALVVKDGRYGFVNRGGRETVPSEYRFAQDYSDGLALTVSGDKGGFINRSG